VNNEEIRPAIAFFEKAENINIGPAAADALAAFYQGIGVRRIKSNELVALDITAERHQRLAE